MFYSLLILFLFTTNLFAFSFGGGSAGSAGFETYQARILKFTQRILNGLDKIEQKIDSNPNMTPEEKAEAKQTIDQIRTQVEKYESEIESAKTTAELIQINKDLLLYLKDNKEEIKKTMAKVLFNTIEYTIPIIEEYIEKVEQMLPMLKKACPQASAQIAALEKELDELKVLLNKLEAFAEAYDEDNPMTIQEMAQYKEELLQAVMLMKSMTITIKSIQTMCLI